MPDRLLVLSNGHGEDLIALRVLDALQRRRPELELAVLPLVGEGHAYGAAEAAGRLRRVGPRQPLPSGGFSNQSLRGLVADLGAGLPLLSWRQWRLVQRWGATGAPILAVGDLMPLLLAWAAGGPFGFIGTPKSDYTWASPPPRGWGASPLADTYHRCKGSEWDPWEWGLMASRRCHLVAVRDRLTARGLRRHGVAALAPGNPMMDGLQSEPIPAALGQRRRLLLLAGSRMPEALHNAARLLAALALLPPQGPLTLLLATGSAPTAAQLTPLLLEQGFSAGPCPPPDGQAAAPWAPDAIWQRGHIQVWIGAGRFEAWAGWAEVGLANAGTATEQLTGLGIPALSLPGAGPQFKAGFARRQSRLLGGAVVPCHNGAQLAQRLQLLLADAALRHQLGAQGRRHMGAAGGSAAIAQLIAQRLLGAAGHRPA
ncbi:MAG: sugar synthetase [Cyanobacteria bacterium M_surface_7_m2_040]|nr:sugar synthetase [Cyanobacteria bacterium K_Offshore_0m_m2_072]MBM5809564.1 sugar synthetase [Cyanobacteria bacterium M_surface_9_m1_291]MBM5827066.1 sugar synthetase [Cyanobacteria bacterium M_surface_7_m2_040]